jgi:hypothetical protein
LVVTQETQPPLSADEHAVLRAVKAWAPHRTVEALAAKSRLSEEAVSAALDGLKARTPPLIYRDPATEANPDNGFGWCANHLGRAAVPEKRFSLERTRYEIVQVLRERRRERARRFPARDPALTQPRSVRRVRRRLMRSKRKDAEYRIKRKRREELGRLSAYYAGYAARIDGRDAMPPKGSSYHPSSVADQALLDYPHLEGTWYDPYEAWVEGWEAANTDYPD